MWNKFNSKKKKQLQVQEFRHIMEINFYKIFNGILSKRIVVKLLQKNKGTIKLELPRAWEWTMEEHLITVQVIVSRQETEFEQTMCSCRLRKGT